MEMEDLTQRMIDRLVPGDPAGAQNLMENAIFSHVAVFLK